MPDQQLALLGIAVVLALLAIITLALLKTNRSLSARLCEVTHHFTRVNQEKIEQHAELINLRWQMKFYQNPPRAEDGRFIPYKDVEV